MVRETNKMTRFISSKQISTAERHQLTVTLQNTIDQQYTLPLQAASAFVPWMIEFLLGNIHPGATFERSSTSLEILLLMTRIWQVSSTNGKKKDQDKEEELSSLLTKRAVVVLLKATVVTWDRVRALACQILVSLRLPWSGFENKNDMRPIVDMALTLAGSPRRREYEAGAQILHMMYDRHVRVLGWSLLEGQLENGEEQQSNSGGVTTPSFLFFHRLCNILCTRLRLQSQNIIQINSI